MRFIVHGAGAIGGVVGARLAQHGHDVVLIARGAHLDVLRRDGLHLAWPEGSETLRLPTVADPAELTFSDEDVVLLAVKSQDTVAALTALEATAPADVPVLCLQNGIANEDEALRRFGSVYAVTVMCPATHLRPGVVHAGSWPCTGIFDIGCYPDGVDGVAVAVAAALDGATFSSLAVPDVMRWKWAKLLMNLANALEALCGPAGLASDLWPAARAEGVACLDAAAIPFASPEEEAARRGDLIVRLPVDGEARIGGSSVQSLARGTGTIEADHLNGEIVRLGRLLGIPTPVNEVLRRWANRAAREGWPPGSVDPATLEAALDRGGSPSLGVPGPGAVPPRGASALGARPAGG